MDAVAARLDTAQAGPGGETSPACRAGARELVDLLLGEEFVRLLREVEAQCEHTQQWVNENQAAHNSGDTDVTGLQDEINAARTVCAKLTEWGRE